MTCSEIRKEYRVARKMMKTCAKTHAVGEANKKWFGDEGHGSGLSGRDACRQRLAEEDMAVLMLLKQMEKISIC